MGRHPLNRLIILLVVCVAALGTSLPALAAGRAPHSTAAQAVTVAADGDEGLSPLSVKVALADLPAVGEKTAVTIQVTSAIAAPGTQVNLVVDAGVALVGESAWH